MTRKFIAFLLIITMFLISGCEPTVTMPSSNPPVENSTNNKTTVSEKTTGENKNSEFVLYTFADSGTALTAQKIPANKLATLDNVQILNYLLKDDKIFDKNARVKSVDVKDHLAQVNFNKDFKSLKVSGSNNELLIVAAIVNTLIDNDPQIKKVQIMIDGKIVESLLGHVDISEPLEKMPELIKK